MKLEAVGVTKTFGRGRNEGVTAVAGVSIKVSPGDFIAIVGESGSGKSTLARMLLGLIEPDQGGGTVLLDGTDLATMSRQQLRAFRRTVQCVLQDPSGSLNPRRTVGRSLREVVKFHGIASSATDVEEAITRILARVGLNPPELFLNRYPHELSGGQRQRVLIARALVLSPKIIIADEAVSALDVVVKASVLNLMNELRREFGIGYVLITHDLAVVKKVASYVYVMRNGEIVEEGPTSDIFARPQHDYTQTLLASAPSLDEALAG